MIGSPLHRPDGTPCPWCRYNPRLRHNRSLDEPGHPWSHGAPLGPHDGRRTINIDGTAYIVEPRRILTLEGCVAMWRVDSAPDLTGMDDDAIRFVFVDGPPLTKDHG